MSRKSWHLSRRTFLQGVGVSCAMPWLEGMAWASGGAREAPRRLCYVYTPNGISLPGASDADYRQWRWFPDGAGADYRFTRVLESLEPHRDQLSVVGGLSHPKSRELLGHLAGDTWLTGGDLRGGAYMNSVSVDQVAAHQLERHTRYPSLVLSVDGGVGYKSRVSTLSFDFEGRPIPSESRQREIFERYFSGGGATTEARRRSLEQGRKVVDLVLEDGRDLKRRLGTRDGRKLDEYLASLSQVEEQVRRNEAWLDVPMKPFDASRLDLDPRPTVDPEAYLRATLDLMVLGFQTDITRVVTFMAGREDGMGFADNFPKLALGIDKGHHTISHDLAEGHWEEWGRYDRWQAEQLAYFLGRMRETEDEHGSLLDHTLVLYGSSCSTTHNARNYPTILAGGSAMGLRHGRYLKYDEATPFSNLLLSTLRAAGVEAESFSDSTGALGAPFA